MIITKYNINTNLNISKDLNLALISDLHENNPNDIIENLKEIKPDIICIAGDTFERQDIGENPKEKDDMTRFEKISYKIVGILHDLAYLLLGNNKVKNKENAYLFINSLKEIKNSKGNSPYIFLSLGNHEWGFYPEDIELLKNNNVNIVHSSDSLIEIENEKIIIGGLYTKVNKEWLYNFEKKNGYKILLSHHPEYYKKYLKNLNIDLILSGHAHGGQIRILNKAIFAPGQGLFPKYHHGLYDNKLIVSAGCANTASVPRFGNPTEVVHIVLKGKHNEN